MTSLGFEELPEDIRVKLEDDAERQLWREIDGCGGVKRFSEETGYSASKMYNWRNKQIYLPVSLVVDVLGPGAVEGVTAIKGGGRSRPMENPVFPMPVNDELLTRIESSVHVNRDGVPVYQTDDRGLANRFVELLGLYGDVPFSVYSRSVYEVRYSKYLHEILSKMGFEEDLSVLIDEKGVIEDGVIYVDGREIDVDEFDGKLSSRSKRLDLALARGDSEEVARIMSEEASRVSQLNR